MIQYYVESIDELEHYGVKGMKWGLVWPGTFERYF